MLYTIVTNYRMGLYCAQRDPGAVVEEDRHYTLIYIFNMFPNSFDFSPWHIIEQDPPFALFYNKERYRSEAGSKAAEMLEIWLTGAGEIKQNIERGDRWWSGPTCIRAVNWTSRNLSVPYRSTCWTKIRKAGSRLWSLLTSVPYVYLPF